MERDYQSAASVEAWASLGDEGQAALASRAAKRAAYVARCYGVQLNGSEIWGDTWAGIVDRLTPEYLTKNSGLTLEAVAFRAAHAAAETWRYNCDKHNSNRVPLEDWNGISSENVERSTIVKTVIEDCFAGLDSRGKAIAQLIISGHTERQTGEAVGISGPAVHKRVARMRRELRAALG